MAYDENQDEFDFVPKTFTFPQDEYKFALYQAKNPKAVFIAKPQAGSMGDNIVLFQDLNQIPTTTKRNNEMIV